MNHKKFLHAFIITLLTFSFTNGMQPPQIPTAQPQLQILYEGKWDKFAQACQNIHDKVKEFPMVKVLQKVVLIPTTAPTNPQQLKSEPKSFFAQVWDRIYNYFKVWQ